MCLIDISFLASTGMETIILEISAGMQIQLPNAYGTLSTFVGPSNVLWQVPHNTPPPIQLPPHYKLVQGYRTDQSGQNVRSYSIVPRELEQYQSLVYAPPVSYGSLQGNTQYIDSRQLATLAANRQVQQQQQAQQQAAAGLRGDGHPESLTENYLAHFHPQQQKQMIGERLYPIVKSVCPELATRLIGMFLGLENAELLSILDIAANPGLLQQKINEFITVLSRHQT